MINQAAVQADAIELHALIPWAERRGLRFAQERGFRSFLREEAKWEAVVGLWDAMKRFRPDRGVAFKTYATRRITGHLLDWMRREDHLSRGLRKTAGEIVRNNRRLNGLPAPERPDATELRDLLAWLRRELSWRDRILVALYFREHMSQRNIALVLGMHESQVSVSLRAALERMRKKLKRHNP